MYHRLVNRQAGRRTDKMYYHTCASPSHKHTDRQMDEMYYCTPTSPTREQSDGQTKYVSPSREQAGRQADKMYYHTCASPSHKQTDRQMDEMYYCTPTSPTREQAGGQTKYVSPHSHGASDGLNNLNGGLPAGQVGCLHADPCTGANRRKNGHAENLPSLVKVHHQPITQPRLVDCTLSGQGHTN